MAALPPGVRNQAHPWGHYRLQYPNIHGALTNNWHSPGGPVSLINNFNGQCPAACSVHYIASDRIEDSRFGAAPHELQSRFHPHTGEIIHDPRGLGGKHNLHNPWHNQYPDGFGPGGPGTGDLVLDIGDFYNLGDTINKHSPNYNFVLNKMGETIEKNLSKDGNAVLRDIAAGGFYQRYPTAATAPPGWPAQFVQPAGGRVAGAGTAPLRFHAIDKGPRHRQSATHHAGWKDAIYHFCRGAGICAHPECVTPLNFHAPASSPNAAYWARKNSMIHHYGMNSVSAADDNILGWVCRHHGKI
jgi:hypothetical protein